MGRDVLRLEGNDPFLMQKPIEEAVWRQGWIEQLVVLDGGCKNAGALPIFVRFARVVYLDDLDPATDDPGSDRAHGQTDDGALRQAYVQARFTVSLQGGDFLLLLLRFLLQGLFVQILQLADFAGQRQKSFQAS